MPNGFSGSAAVKYLGHAHSAHTRAMGTSQNSAPNLNPNHAPRGTRMPVPPRQRDLPFTPEDAQVGRFITGRGDSSNIVVDQYEYQEVSRTISHIDDRIGECIYRTAIEIEEMCRTIFMMPMVTPQCMNYCDTVKSSLSQFRDLAEDMALESKRFAREITEIGL